MPGFDKTGPNGAGSQTGRGRGLCASETTTGTRPMLGRGFGRGNARRSGRGFGRGFGFANYQANDKEVLTEEKKALENRIKYINEQLEK